MSKSSKITFIFVLIFVVGVLSFVAYINHSLNNPNYSSSDDLQDDDLSFHYSFK